MMDIANSLPFPPAYLILGLGLFILFLFTLGGKKRGIISNDDMTLKSERLGLIGRPDRIIKEEDGTWIPIEKKSSVRVQDSHRAQLAVYMILIEEITGKRPPYGYIALRDNSQKKVMNSDKLRSRVWDSIKQIRQLKNAPNSKVKAAPFPAKCAACGYNKVCSYSKA